LSSTIFCSPCHALFLMIKMTRQEFIDPNLYLIIYICLCQPQVKQALILFLLC